MMASSDDPSVAQTDGICAAGDLLVVSELLVIVKHVAPVRALQEQHDPVPRIPMVQEPDDAPQAREAHEELVLVDTRPHAPERPRKPRMDYGDLDDGLCPVRIHPRKPPLRQESQRWREAKAAELRAAVKNGAGEA